MKALLIYPNVSVALTPQMGLLSLGSYLASCGIETSILDLTFIPSGQYLPAVARAINVQRPSLVGISVRSMEVAAAKAICRAIKSGFPNIPLVAGGPHVTFEPEDLAPYCDYCVLGEGEDTLLDICRAIEEGKPERVRELQNVAYWEANELRRNPLRPLLDMARLPIPHWSMFDERHYRQHFGLGIIAGARVCGTFEGSRGCPFQCSYCSNDSLRGMYRGLGHWRREKSETRISDEMASFRASYGMDMAYFVDEVMMTSTRRVDALGDHLGPLGIPFIFMDRAELITDDRAKAMKRAGAASCSIGIESGDAEFRRRLLGRTMSDETIQAAFKSMRLHGIKTHAFIMMGLPGQTAEIMESTYALLKSIQPDTAQATTFYPLPGTRLAAFCREEGLLSDTGPVTSYYSSSRLNYTRSHKRCIDAYCHLVNLGAWRGGKWANHLESIGRTFPAVLPWVYWWQICSDSLRSRGWIATVVKILNKVSGGACILVDRFRRAGGGVADRS